MCNALARMSHDNLIFESMAVWEHMFTPIADAAKPDEVRVVSYLPLSHVAAQMIDVCGSAGFRFL